jgi:Flp pilus assembly protein TadB
LLPGVVVVVAVVAVVVVVVAGGAAVVIPIWISRSRKARQTKNGNRFMPVLPQAIT